MNSNKPLLTPFTLSDLELQNRVVMAPMTRSRADNSEKAPTDLHAEYYRQRASAGLIISEGSQISERAVGYINTPGIHKKAHVAGWKKVTRAVHEEGGKIFCQLWHVGRMSHPDFHNGELPLAPSAINPKAKSYTPAGFKDTVAPREMSLEDIEQTIADFKQAAKNALEAGFDGVEIHASNGYLLHQFFNSTSNVRTDAYGGSAGNRARILFEVLEAVKSVVPENRIGVRLNPSLHGAFGMTLNEETIPTFDYIIGKLNEYDLAYLHLTEPGPEIEKMPHAEPNVARRYRPLYEGTLIINGGFDEASGNRIIEAGDADLVAYGKLFISNPDLPLRIAQEAPLAEWDSKTFYTPGEKGYIDYPMLEEVER